MDALERAVAALAPRSSVEPAVLAELFDDDDDNMGAATATGTMADDTEAVRAAGHDKLMALWMGALATIKTDATLSQAAWAVLASYGVTMKILVAFLYRDVTQGGARAMTAGTIYMQLLQMAGADAYGIANNIVLDACLRKLREGVADVLHEHESALIASLDEENQETPTSTENKGKKRTHEMDDGSDDATEGTCPMDDDDEDDNEDDTMDLGDTGGSSPYAAMTGVMLAELEAYLAKAQLQHQADLVDRIVDIFMTILQGIRNFAASAIPAPIAKILPHLDDLIESLLSLRFGVPSDNLAKIFHGLLPVLVMLRNRKPSGASAIPRPIMDGHTHAKLLVLRLIDRVKVDDTAVMEGKTMSSPHEKILVLMQHLCTRVPDRNEYRTCVAKVVAAIFQRVPTALQTAFLDWFHKLGRNSKVACRVFALDVAADLLPTLQHETSSAEDGMMATTEPVVVLSELLMSRAHDKMPSVRARALGVLADLITSNNPMSSMIVASILDSDGWLERRSRDDKSVVRRTAIQLIQATLKATAQGTVQYNAAPLVTLLEERCRDPIMTLRRLAAVALTDVLLNFWNNNNTGLWTTWIRAVFPMIIDREVSVQDEVGDQTVRVLLDPWRSDDRAELSERGLAALAGTDPANLKHFQRIVAMWGKRGGLKKDVTNRLVNFTRAHINHLGAWIMLSELFSSAPQLGDSFMALQAWKEIRERPDVGEDLMALVVRTLGIIAGKLAPEASIELTNEFCNKLRAFAVPIPLISAMVQCATQLFAQSPATQAGIVPWCHQIMTECSRLLGAASTTTDDETLSRCLFVVGDIYQMNPGMLSDRVLTMIQSVVASPSEHEMSLISYSTPVRAQGFVTIGKICLLNEDFAKRYTSALARELSVCKDAVIRNNVMLVLCDLCVRYASLVDKYVPTISVCLHDSNELVRRQTLTMLTRLLQEDYIKWKGSLFFRFVCAVVDESQEIREFAKFCLVQLLLNKNPGIFYTNFQELLFFLNAYTPARSVEKIRVSQTANTGDQGGSGDHAFRALAGPGDNERKRHEIYSFLASNLTDELRFQLIGKLCSETLANVIDGTIDVNDPGAASVVSDALHVLASKELKLQSWRSAATGDGDDEMSTQEKALDAAKTKLLSKLTKKNTVENILPILVSLKRHLESLHSPLLRHLMLALRTIVKEYRLEMEDLLTSDRQLANEIEFDIRQFEKHELSGSPAAPAAPASPSKSAKGAPSALRLAKDRRSWNVASPIRPLVAPQPEAAKRGRSIQALGGDESMGEENDEDDGEDDELNLGTTKRTRVTARSRRALEQLCNM